METNTLELNLSKWTELCSDQTTDQRLTDKKIRYLCCENDTISAKGDTPDSLGRKIAVLLEGMILVEAEHKAIKIRNKNSPYLHVQKYADGSETAFRVDPLTPDEYERVLVEYVKRF